MTERILITGAAGFFGSHLIEHVLRNTDWEVVGLVRTSKVGHLRRIFDQGSYDEARVRLVFHDFRWPLPVYIRDDIGTVQYIAHVGAETHVDRSITQPEEFVGSNVMGTLNLLQYARGCEQLRWFNLFSTDEVYGPAPEGVLHSEEFPYDARNPYAASKAGAEQLGNAFANTFGLPLFTTNTMNLIGERQNREKFVPKVIRAVLDGEVLMIHADPTRTIPGSRFYLHCRNAADALLWLFNNHAEPRGRFNIVGEREIDNLELAKTISDIVGVPLRYELVDFHSSRPGHDLRYALDGHKLWSMGYAFPVGFDESLERTVRWTVENPEWLR
ncbi:MAG: dTDP-glucose 4,6-dehydratase [Anaerolineales bacterium]